MKTNAIYARNTNKPIIVPVGGHTTNSKNPLPVAAVKAANSNLTGQVKK